MNKGSTSSIVNDLRNGEKSLGIWGLGFIGYSDMAFFARNGVRCLGTDVSKERVEEVNSGRTGISNLEFWLAFDVKPLAHAGMMKATLDWKKLVSPDVPVNLVCVPTEKDGRPYDDVLVDVITKLCGFKRIKMDHPPLVIIESTLTPDRVDKVVLPLLEKNGIVPGRDMLVGVAPRRDWFASPDKTLETIPRVVGGVTPETTDIMAELLGLVCQRILKASDHKHAAIVKSIENAYRHMDIILANQLSRAYPDMDITEVLRLVGTKWNVEVYHPSFGIGGYCLPLAPQYVLMGADHPEELTLLEKAVECDRSQPDKVAESLERRGVKDVGILGLAYREDIRVDILSPTKGIVKGLKARGIKVKVNDPYYSDDDIRRMTGAEPFAFPEGLREFEAVLLVTGHMVYNSLPTRVLKENLAKCRVILDNMGNWKGIDFGSIEYHEAGDKGWLK